MINSEETPFINIKGIRDGLLITLDGSHPNREMIAKLGQDIGDKSSFLRNSRVALEVGGRILTHHELAEIQELLANHGMALWAILSRRAATRNAARNLGLATRLPGSQVDLPGSGSSAPDFSLAEQDADYPPNALYLKETIRAGRAIYSPGHIVIIGDVDPGAEIVAEGDVIVWGKLRGLVHAGASGADGATVSALDLSPIQLRIGDQFSVTPPLDPEREPIPEIALIREGRIVAEPWL